MATTLTQVRVQGSRFILLVLIVCCSVSSLHQKLHGMCVGCVCVCVCVSVSQIQGGDPTGTGTGGKSIWKKPFQDEIRLNLKHEG